MMIILRTNNAADLEKKPQGNVDLREMQAGFNTYRSSMPILADGNKNTRHRPERTYTGTV